MEPHAPYAPPAVRGQFSTARTNAAVNREKAHGFADGDITEDRLDHAWDLYMSEVRRADQAVERVVDALHQDDYYENTWIIIVGDHGEEFMEHGLMGHSVHLYDELVNVPLVVKPPAGIEVADTVPGLVGLVDLFPTLADIADGDPPPDLRGQSLLNALSTGETDHRAVIAQSDFQENHCEAVRTERWKLIVDGGNPSLYDLQRDPEEQHDVAADNPETVARLRDILAERTGEGDLNITDVTDDADRDLSRQLEDLGYL